MRIVAAALLAIGVLGVVGAAQGHATISPVGWSAAPPLRGSIVFWGGPGHGGLYGIDANGGPLRELALGDINAAHWSPDGRELGFEQLSSEGSTLRPGLYVMGERRQPRLLFALTDEQRRLTSHYSWAPDGRTIAYDQAGTIWVVPSAGGRKRRLTSRGGDWAPVWSPDGRTIVFQHAGALRVADELDTMSPDGTHRRRLADGGGPDWSPDGKRLVYDGKYRGGVFVINADGTARRRILGRGNIVVPAWSPDGRWIALTGNVGTQSGTFVVRPDGSGFRRISPAGDSLSPPSWSPDSRSLVVEDAFSVPDDWVVAADGSSQRRLTEGWRYGYGNYRPEWNPRGIPTAQFEGTDVPWSLPTDSVADPSALRTTQPVTRLVADGSDVAVAHDDGQAGGYEAACAEVWDPVASSLTTFPGCLTPTGFGFTGGRFAASHFERGGGTVSWSVWTGTIDVPNFNTVHGVPEYVQPISDFVGHGSLLTFDSWGDCTRDGPPVCAPKINGTLYRLDGTNAIKIASSAGALTPLSVDAGRILVDHENGTLELMRSDGTSLQTFHVYLGDFLGAKLQGREVVVLKHATIADYDAVTGLLLHEWTFATSADRQLDDVQDGMAVYISGTEVHLLRLSDGREAVITVPGTGPVLAQLEPTGLFYS